VPLGPDNSSGTNNTIKTTRMIAPVSRSFTRNSVARSFRDRSSLVYAKPLQCRTDRVDGPEHEHAVTRHSDALRSGAPCFDRVR